MIPLSLSNKLKKSNRNLSNYTKLVIKHTVPQQFEVPKTPKLTACWSKPRTIKTLRLADKEILTIPRDLWANRRQTLADSVCKNAPWRAGIILDSAQGCPPSRSRCEHVLLPSNRRKQMPNPAIACQPYRHTTIPSNLSLLNLSGYLRIS